MYLKSLLAICILLFFTGSQIFCQITDYESFRKDSPTPSRLEAPVNLEINYITLDDVSDLKEYKDTTLLDFEKYTEHRTFDNGALNLGNLGSASQKIIYSNPNSIFTNLGFHQYDIYKKNINEYPIYQSNKIFNDLIFSPLGSSQNFFSGAKFSKAFSNKTSLSIDFNRIKQEGFYTDQDTKITQLGVCLQKKNKSESHHYLISFVANNFNDFINGGIAIETDSLYTEYNEGQERNQRTSVPVRTGQSSGQTRHQDFSYALDNYFNIDSGKYKVHHQINLEHGYFRFGDENTTSFNDTLNYGNYLTDNRGLRLVNRFWRMINKFDIGLTLNQFQIKVGLEYNYLNHNNSQSTENIHDLALSGRILFNVEEKLKFDGQAKLGIGENAGNFLLHPKISFNVSELIQLNAFTKLLRYDPSLIDQQAIVSDIVVYNNDFSKVNEVVLGGNIEVPKIGISLDLKSGLIDNAISLNTDALPIQNEGSTEYLQLSLKQKLFWKFIGIENDICYQKFSDNIYNLPERYSIHNLYLKSFLFRKRLEAQVGILYYNYKFDGYLNFMPVTGQFYPSEDSFRNYNYTEVYGVFKVDHFRIFFKMENFTDFVRKEPHFQIVNYPQLDAKFRMGVRWQLFD